MQFCKRNKRHSNWKSRNSYSEHNYVEDPKEYTENNRTIKQNKLLELVSLARLLGISVHKLISDTTEQLSTAQHSLKMDRTLSKKINKRAGSIH